ncbi:MAG: PqqD family protein [Ignavibacteria bacterium]|nr:PqqD family protein [Ignavibacteria bacterium]
MKELNRRLKSLALSDSGFIFDPSTGQTFTTNETGLDIIRLLKEEKSVEDILAYIEQHYDGKSDVIFRDTTQFLAQMKTYRLIDEV